MVDRGRGEGLPDLPDDKFDLLSEVEGGREGPPGTAAVVGEAAGGVTVAAVARHLLLTAGPRVERQTDLSSSQRPAENSRVTQSHSGHPPPVFNTDKLQFQTLKAFWKVLVFTLS